MPPKSRLTKKAEFIKEYISSECQTDLYDEEFERNLQGLKSLKDSLASEEGTSLTEPSKNPNVLFYQLKVCTRIISKLSVDAQKTKKENERIISVFGEIFRLVRAMKSEYDATLLNARDSMMAMSGDMARHISDVQELLSKQKCVAEEDRKKYKRNMKSKDARIEHLQEKLKTSTDNLATVMEALEAQQRIVTLSERDVHMAREEVKEVNRKLNDQLFLAGNQKCMSCQANEKVREMLSNEVAEKTNTANVFHQKYCEIENLLIHQKRVNEILSRSVDKHAFSEKAIRGEFERVKTEYNNLLAETRTLRSQAKAETAAAVTSVTITPPDSSASEKSSKAEETAKPISDSCAHNDSIANTVASDNSAKHEQNVVKRALKRAKHKPTNDVRTSNVDKIAADTCSKKITDSDFGLSPLNNTECSKEASSSLNLTKDDELSSTKSDSVITVDESNNNKISNEAKNMGDKIGKSNNKASKAADDDHKKNEEVEESENNKKAEDNKSTSDTKNLNNEKEGTAANSKLTASACKPAASNKKSAASNAKPIVSTVKTISKTTFTPINAESGRKRIRPPNSVKSMRAKQIRRSELTPLLANIQKTVRPGNFFEPIASQGSSLFRPLTPLVSVQRQQQQRAMEARRLAALQEEVILRERQIMRERQQKEQQMLRIEAQQIQIIREQQLRVHRERFANGGSLQNLRNFNGHHNGAEIFSPRQLQQSPPRGMEVFGRLPHGMQRPPEPLFPRLPWHGAGAHNSASSDGARPSQPFNGPSNSSWVRMSFDGRRS